MQEEALTRQLEANKGTIQQLTQQRVFLNRQLSQATTVQEHNRLVGMTNEINDRINLLNNAAEDTGRSKEIRAQASNRREAYIQALLDLRALADSTAKAYEELAEDAEVKEALAALSKPSRPKVTLGPSRTHLANVKLLEKAEAGILTETIQLRSDNGVFWVDVTLNGKVTIPMIFDTGAGILSLGEADAAKAGLVPSPSDRTITLNVADGSSHEAQDDDARLRPGREVHGPERRVRRLLGGEVERAAAARRPLPEAFHLQDESGGGDGDLHEDRDARDRDPEDRPQGEDRRTFATWSDVPGEGRPVRQRCRYAVREGELSRPVTSAPSGASVHSPGRKS